MDGPSILVNSLSAPHVDDRYGNRWQYHSRSDRHSKIACWGVAFDLLGQSALLRAHVGAGKVVLGINHRMVDFGTGRAKNLDLVFARPSGERTGVTFDSLVERHGIRLTGEQHARLGALPVCAVAPVGAVLVALEAKAVMTAHVRALPRLYDELNSSHLCVHGASRQAIAIGFVMVNSSSQFVSSDLNKHNLEDLPAVVSSESQPNALIRTLHKVGEIPRRSNVRENGFDGIGVVVIAGRNDGSPFRLIGDRPAPQQGESFHYESMIVRMANEYDSNFPGI